MARQAELKAVAERERKLREEAERRLQAEARKAEEARRAAERQRAADRKADEARRGQAGGRSAADEPPATRWAAIRAGVARVPWQTWRTLAGLVVILLLWSGISRSCAKRDTVAERMDPPLAQTWIPAPEPYLD